MKRSLVFVTMAVILVSAVWSISKIGTSEGSKPPAKPAKPKPLVTAQTVELGEIATRLELTGSVEPTRVARLASPAEGPIIACTVREGDIVKKGDHLLSIGRKKGAEALLASATQELKNEEAELERIKQLVESGAIPKDQLDLAQTRRARMLAQLEKMKETSEDYEVRAPWDGVVSKVLVAEGNYVAARTVLVEIFDPDSLVIRTAVPEADSQNIAPGLVVSVSLDAHPGKKFTGKIARVFPELDRRSRTRTAEVEMAGDVQLAPGMFARLNMDLEKRNEAVVVPSEAIMVTPKGSRIVFILKDCKTFQRKVETGVEAGGKVEILSGVTPGEKIVVAGNEKLKDGMEVRTNVFRMGKATGEKGGNASGAETKCQ